jgi:hypothetical protein
MQTHKQLIYMIYSMNICIHHSIHVLASLLCNQHFEVCVDIYIRVNIYIYIYITVMCATFWSRQFLASLALCYWV